MTMPGAPRSARPIPRLARLLLGRNRLRRRSDRIEGVLLLVLVAVFGVVVAVASVLGTRIYHWQRAGAARLHPVVAVLARTWPIDNLGGSEEAWARWRAPDGRRLSGTLTMVNVPSIWEATGGNQVRVWVTRTG